jgi:hypothetical protein
LVVRGKVYYARARQYNHSERIFRNSYYKASSEQVVVTTNATELVKKIILDFFMIYMHALDSVSLRLVESPHVRELLLVVSQSDDGFMTTILSCHCLP